MKARHRLALLFIALCARLPLGCARLLGLLGGALLWRAKRRTRRAALANVSLCLPQLPARQRCALARRGFLATACTLAELGRVWRHPTACSGDLLRGEQGRQLLSEGLAGSKGVLVLAPHLGNWEALGPYLASIAPLTCLYQTPRYPALAQRIVQARLGAGMHLAPATSGGIRQLLRALRRGELAAILPDLEPPLALGEFAPFFGVPALTMTLAPRLLAKTGAYVVFAYAARVPGGFRMVLRPASPQLHSEHLPTALAALNEGLEECIRAIPEQYHWHYKRFKRRPTGQTAVY